MIRTAALAALAAALPFLLPAAASAEELAVNPDAGNSGFSAVFDAAVGERINAVSSAVGCELSHDEKTGLVSGHCSVPLTSIWVDNDDTKSEHFQQWATNKKSAPKDCKFEAVLAGVRIGTLVPEKPVPFTAEIPFTICGRGRADGGKEQLSGTALLLPAGSYGDKKTIRLRATIAGFDREAYQIGPKFTEGWLARVQSLAKAVATTGSIELSLFAKPR